MLSGLTLRRCARIGHLVLLPILLASSAACGAPHALTVPPVVLSVSVAESPVSISPGETVYVPVTVQAPTETVTFMIQGLPAGSSASYKESESNPSGQLTLTANSTTPAGLYQCRITVGSSGQTASTSFSLHVVAAS